MDEDFDDDDKLEVVIVPEELIARIDLALLAHVKMAFQKVAKARRGRWLLPKLQSCMAARLLPLALLILSLPGAHGRQPSEGMAIRSVLAREPEGWNNFDAKEVASTFTEDAVSQNPFGVRLRGNQEIEKFLTGLMAGPGYRAGKSTTPIKILDLRVTSRTTAPVWSDARIEGLVNDFSVIHLK